MKRLIIGLLMTALALSSQAAIELSFENPQGFRDFKVGTRSGEAVANMFRNEFERTAERRFSNWIPEGHTLKLNITDVDMAGEIQPWRNRDHADIRYIERIYPPSISFEYTLINADGDEVKSGQERVRDLAFDFNVSRPQQNTTFHHEIALIDSWLRNNIRPLTRQEG